MKRRKFVLSPDMPNIKDFILLIHSAYPQSRLGVIIVFTHVICTYVRPDISISRKAKQISSENNICYCFDCGSGRGDRWWHLFMFFVSWTSSYASMNALCVSHYKLENRNSHGSINTWQECLISLITCQRRIPATW